jgi:hypothetical protein
VACPGDLIATDVLGPLHPFSETGAHRYQGVAEIALSEIISALDEPSLCRRWQ